MGPGPQQNPTGCSERGTLRSTLHHDLKYAIRNPGPGGNTDTGTDAPGWGVTTPLGKSTKTILSTKHSPGGGTRHPAKSTKEKEHLERGYIYHLGTASPKVNTHGSVPLLSPRPGPNQLRARTRAHMHRRQRSDPATPVTSEMEIHFSLSHAVHARARACPIIPRVKQLWSLDSW